MVFYSFRHILIIFTCMVLPILWAKGLKKNPNILKYSIYLLSCLEIIRIIYLIITKNFQINRDLSLQLCFTYIIIALIFLKTKKNYLLSYLGAFGLLFGTVAIILRDPNPFLSFDVWQCYIYHSVMVFIGSYILMHYKTSFSFKCIIIIWIQIIIGLIANIIIKNGSNYIFLNSFLSPSYHLPYAVNIEVFNMPMFNGYSINSILLNLINTLGNFYYIILFSFVITLFSCLWLYIVNQIKKIKE